jgi:hypothetical protein
MVALVQKGITLISNQSKADRYIDDPSGLEEFPDIVTLEPANADGGI